MSLSGCFVIKSTNLARFWWQETVEHQCLYFALLCLFSYTEIKRLHIWSYRDYRIAGSVWQLISVAVHKQGLAGNLGFSTSNTLDKLWIEQTFICILARVCLYCVVSLHSFSNGCVLCSLLTIVLSYPYYTSISDVFALDVLHLLHVPYCLWHRITVSAVNITSHLHHGPEPEVIRFKYMYIICQGLMVFLWVTSKELMFYECCVFPQLSTWNTFVFMHLADAFIQSDLQCIQVIIFFMCVPWELNPQTFALLTQCSTTEPQEHKQGLPGNLGPLSTQRAQGCLKVTYHENLM